LINEVLIGFLCKNSLGFVEWTFCGLVRSLIVNYIGFFVLSSGSYFRLTDIRMLKAFFDSLEMLLGLIDLL
jgi:hypothetical protein